jgi:hypothetical protein
MLARSGTKVSPTIVQLHRLRSSGVIASSHANPIGRAQKELFGKEVTMTEIKETLSVLGWYHILRAHYTFTFLQAVRYALWLAR